MFQRILVPTDGSEITQRAVAVALTWQSRLVPRSSRCA